MGNYEIIDYELIGRRIKDKRLEKGLTQETLSEKLELSPEYVSKIENGRVEINLKRLAELSLLLECPIEYLVAGTVIDSPDYKVNELNQLMKSCSPKERDVIHKIAELVATLKE